MIHFKRSQILILSILSLFVYQVRGHGYLKTPRSRNYVADASQEGTWTSAPGAPKAESCPHCLNRKEAHKVCGKTQTMDYDDWNDSQGNPMSWASQGVYEAGDLFTVESYLSANHAGHMEIWLCPDIDNLTQECFESNPTTLISDDFYGGPVDSDYPERAYYASGKENFKHTYQLPDDVIGDKVMMQWRYVTANSCFPPGYKDSHVTDTLRELGWLRAEGMGPCNYPLNPTGDGVPEQFWNCAEITIYPKGGAPPSTPIAAPVSQPVSQPVSMPVSMPVTSPTSTSGYCTKESICNGNDVDGAEWCDQSQSNCLQCSGKWCGTGPMPSPDPAPFSTSSPTTSPSSRPSLRRPPVTPAPVTPAPVTPTPAPVDSPPTGGGDYCCSWNFSSCGDSAWCNESESRCSNCGGNWINPEEQSNCIAKWGTCTNDVDGCCAPSVCSGSSIWYKQCL